MAYKVELNIEEMDYVPSMKFASGFEIMEYCQKLCDKFGMYENHAGCGAATKIFVKSFREKIFDA